MNYLFFKKIHRVLVLVIMFFTMLMSLTGIILKYPKITDVVTMDLIFVRNLHNVASPFFGLTLFIMMISGAVMYFYPVFLQRRRSK